MAATPSPFAPTGKTLPRRRVPQWLALAVLLGLAARVAFLQGLVKPVRVAGASMAETLLGDHFEVRCRDCGFPCRYDAEEPPRDERVVCPNCGGVQHGREGTRAYRGDRVLIDRLAYHLSAPQRWDLVAFRMPDDERRWAVKRVLGLPGERVEIRAGDIYVDGKIQRKSLAQFRSLAILVHDSHFAVPTDRALPPRWGPETLPSGWRQTHGEFTCEPGWAGAGPSAGDDAPAASSGDYDWLTYRHWRCFSSPLPRTAESPILDNYGYNQDESRHLQRVTDLLLICRICVASGAGRFAIRAEDGRDHFEVTLDPGAHQGRLARNGREVLTAALPQAAYASGVNLAWALCDQRIALAIDEQTVFEHDYSPAAEAGHPSPRPLAIGTCGLGISVRWLQVFRDIHYLDPVGLPRDWVSPRPLDANQFFLAGDNSPRSRDSRQDPGGGVSRRLVLGKVLTGR